MQSRGRAADTGSVADTDDEQLSEEERRRRWNTAVMAGAVAPTAAPWAMPKAGWRQLRESPKAVVATALVYLVAALLIIAVLLGHRRLAAYAVLALFALYLCACAIYLAARGITRYRRR